MALFGSPNPVVLKEGSTAEEQLRQMEAAKGTFGPRAEARLEKDLRLVRAGIDGERRILYELKNSHMDMFILQDLFLEHEGLTAQIDFLVITPQRNFVIECKNLVGNIEINSRGDFIRSFEGGKREGIYSPIAQNQRHLGLIKALRKAGRSTVANLVAGSSTDDVYHSLVVLTNPKTILNDRYAKRDIKAQVATRRKPLYKISAKCINDTFQHISISFTRTNRRLDRRNLNKHLHSINFDWKQHNYDSQTYPQIYRFRLGNECML